MEQTKRYTLPLPEVIYNKISEHATKYGRSMRDVLQQCIRFGLTAIEIDANPNQEIILREYVTVEGKDKPVVKERVLYFVW